MKSPVIESAPGGDDCLKLPGGALPGPNLFCPATQTDGGIRIAAPKPESAPDPRDSEVLRPQNAGTAYAFAKAVWCLY
jgi:hypothetical protein